MIHLFLLACLAISSEAFVSSVRTTAPWKVTTARGGQTSSSSALAVSTLPPPIEDPLQPPLVLGNSASLDDISSTIAPTDGQNSVFAPDGDTTETEFVIAQQNKRITSFTAPSIFYDNDDKNGMSLWQGRLLVIAAAALCGTNFCAVKMLDQSSGGDTATAAALRFTLAAATVTAAVLSQEMRRDNGHVSYNHDKIECTTTRDVYQHQQQRDRKAALRLGAEVGVWYGIAYISQAVGLHSVDASKSAFFSALAVIVVPLLDSLFKSNKSLSFASMASIAMAIGGVALLQMGPSEVMPPSALHHVATSHVAVAHHHHHHATSFLSTMTPGDWCCLAQALFFGIGYWRLEAASVRFPQQTPRIIVGELLATAGLATAYMLADTGLPNMAQLQQWCSNPFALAAVVWTGVLGTALPQYFETVALRVLSASELTVLMTSISLFGSAFAYITMGETLTLPGMLGGLLILSGCVLTSTGGNQELGEEEEESSELGDDTLSELAR